MAGVLLAEVHFLNGFKGLYLRKTSVARGLRIDFMFGWWMNVKGKWKGEISHCTPFSGGRVGVYLSAKAEDKETLDTMIWMKKHSHQRK